ncbi:Major intrinsic protein (fragment) [Cupriavidus taiwanensis]
MPAGALGVGAVGDMLTAFETPGFALLGGSLFGRAPTSSQKTRRLCGWQSIPRVGGSDGGDFRLAWVPVRAC